MIRERIAQLVANVTPLDEREIADQEIVLDWIASGADLFRVQKPDIPATHLVSYFVLVDPTADQLLLVDHITAGLWVPTGGHVEPNEDPSDAVRRECQEELHIEADFLTFQPRPGQSALKPDNPSAPQPLFITATTTRGLGQHTDVSLWYVLRGDYQQPLQWDPAEFKSVRWWEIRDIINSPIQNFDPELHRFCNKLQVELARG